MKFLFIFSKQPTHSIMAPNTTSLHSRAPHFILEKCDLIAYHITLVWICQQKYFIMPRKIYFFIRC